MGTHGRSRKDSAKGRPQAERPRTDPSLLAWRGGASGRGGVPRAGPGDGAGRGGARPHRAAMAADGDWQEFYEFQEPARSPRDQESYHAGPEAGPGPGGAGGGFPALARSLEEKLSLCFRPSGPGAEPPRAAVRPITECSLLQGDE